MLRAQGAVSLLGLGVFAFLEQPARGGQGRIAGGRIGGESDTSKRPNQGEASADHGSQDTLHGEPF